MKKVLGLDLGTTSIGWALVKQADSPDEESRIIRAGVRVNPLSSEERDQFEKGKAITTNADRTIKRQMRRNLQRYKLRREALLTLLIKEGWIDSDTCLSEDGPGTTFQTLRLRAEAVSSAISLEELSRVLLAINKKRGYKSSRKASSSEEGHLIDGMDVAKALYNDGITPGQYAFNLLKTGKTILPDFYRSDLVNEFNQIWENQAKYYPGILTEEFKEKIQHHGQAGASKLFLSTYNIETADNKGKDRKLVSYNWRSDALRQKLESPIMAYAICSVLGDIANSSGYLGAISDRSKELYFKDLTVGQYLYANLMKNPHYSTKNVVFYRQDYIDEFERIWEFQKQYHKELTDSLKSEIRDIVIFYQRRLKSQKGLISFCEFEKKTIPVNVDGKIKYKTRGCRVAPRSSILFQEFKIWQTLNNIVIIDREDESARSLFQEEKEFLAKELKIKRKLSSTNVLKFLKLNTRQNEMNFKEIEGNATICSFFEKFIDIVNVSGHGEYDLAKMFYDDAYTVISEVFSGLGFNTDFLDFDSSLEKEAYEQQALFKLWHLIYSYEGDNSPTGNNNLIDRISQICGLPREYATIVSEVKLLQDYASLSHKAIKSILPYLKEGNTYDLACMLAGYNHSHSVTAEERERMELVDVLPTIPKGELRNPVVEKILNQMVNVINQVSETYGKPDEIHIELARELKQSQKERESATQSIESNSKRNAAISRILMDEYGLTYVSRKDIIRYRLFEELKDNGYKTLYSNKYIPKELLFSPNIDIEHIIPQALFFDDSFANKTLEYRDINLEKGSMTAHDYVLTKGTEAYEDYKARVDDLFARNVISKTKRRYLLMSKSEIPEDFINRDLRDSQYIAKKAKEMLESYVRTVVSTSGSITKELREQWQLVDMMKELNLPKYEQLGKVTVRERGDGNKVKLIDDWTKRNDHRHHAMDAITIAFTKPQHINILNHLNATKDEGSQYYGYSRNIAPPMPVEVLRQACKKELESILVSIKAKNKVVTKTINKTRAAGGSFKRTTTLTPRGSLHKEQIYGLRMIPDSTLIPINAKMGYELVDSVINPFERKAIKARLDLFGGDAKLAFTGKNSLEKNPIIVQSNGKEYSLPKKVMCRTYKRMCSIRKEIGPDLKVDKVLDPGIKAILSERLKEFNGDPRKAFSNLDENPIWLNYEKGICIKRVTIVENFDLPAIRDKRDKDGRIMLDSDNKTIPSDYVNLRNNHHVAIYEDAEGNYQEDIVPFFKALQRVTSDDPVIDKTLNKDQGWRYVMNLKVNEYFVFPNPESGFYPEDIDLMDEKNYALISPNLFRVQKLSSKYYVFRHHLETESSSDDLLMKDIIWKRINSINQLKGAVKVRINHIGQIVAVGDYD